MKKRGKSTEKKIPGQTRKNRLVCCLNDHELSIVEDYLKKYKVKNKGRWMRETLLGSIYKSLGENYPTLFDEHEMRM